MLEICSRCGGYLSRDGYFERGFRVRYICQKCGTSGLWYDSRGDVVEASVSWVRLFDDEPRTLDLFGWSSSKYDFLS